VEDTLVLDDRNQPLPIPEVRQTVLGNIRTWTLKPYPYLVEVRDDGMVNQQVTARLNAVGIYWGSPVTVDLEKTADMEVMEILRSSDRSWTSTSLLAAQEADYVVPPETEPHLLAVALGGRFSSFFTDKGAPAGRLKPGPEGEDPVVPRAEVPLTLSPETRLVVVGNASYVSDLVGSLLSQGGGGFFLENLAFVENLIDWTTLDNDLITIRARGAGTRRLERLERSQEITIEGINYLLPTLFLLGLAGYRVWHRRQILPAVGPARPTRKV
jgi:ABC-2 type transport system permease protein